MSRTRAIVLVTSGALLVACGAVLGVALFLTAGPVRAADRFFLAVKDEGAAGARPLLAHEFLARTGAEELAARLSAAGLTRVREARWTHRSLTLGGGRAELGGAVETADGRSVPVQLLLVTEGGAWKVYALSIPGPAPSERASDRLPAPDEQITLVRSGVHALGVSRNGGDFTPFWKEMSQLWQTATTVDEIRAVFLDSGALHGDLTALDGVRPAIVGVSKLEEGVLTIQVRYDVDGGPVYVRGRYVHDPSGWRLIGFSVGSTPRDG